MPLPGLPLNLPRSEYVQPSSLTGALPGQASWGKSHHSSRPKERRGESQPHETLLGKSKERKTQSTLVEEGPACESCSPEYSIHSWFQGGLERRGRPTAPGAHPRRPMEQSQDRVDLGLGVRLPLPPTPTNARQVTSSPRLLIFTVCENSQGSGAATAYRAGGAETR